MTTIEQDRHRLAFDAYRDLGPFRSYKAVAEQMGVSDRTIRLWAKTFHWRDRLLPRETGTPPSPSGNAVSSTFRERDQLKKSARLAFKRVVEALAAGRDVSRQVSNLDRIVRLITFLDGGPKGPDPTNVDDVRAFLDAIPNPVLEVIAGKPTDTDAEIEKVREEMEGQP
jgi:transposase